MKAVDVDVLSSWREREACRTVAEQTFYILGVADFILFLWKTSTIFFFNTNT
jgi:hypothetical protein